MNIEQLKRNARLVLRVATSEGWSEQDVTRNLASGAYWQQPAGFCLS